MSMLNEHKTLKKRTSSKRKDEYWVRYEKFVKQQRNLFDIIVEVLYYIMFATSSFAQS